MAVLSGCNWRPWMLAPYLLFCALLSGCTDPVSAPGAAPATPSAATADILVYVRIPRDMDDAFNFTLRIVSPAGVVREGFVAVVPDTVIESRERTGGHFRGRDPSTTSPYPYAVFEDVVHNGTWTVDVIRTENKGLLPPVGNTGRVNACAYVGFSDPDRKLRIFQGDASHELRDPDGWTGFSDARLWFEYGNWTRFQFERRAADTCAA